MTSEMRYIIFSCYFKNTAEYFENPGGKNQRGTRRNVFQRFEEFFMIQEGLRRRGTSNHDILNIFFFFQNTAVYFKNSAGKINVGQKFFMIQEGLQKRGTLFFHAISRTLRFKEFFMIQEGLWKGVTLFFHAISRTLLNISRILLDKINVGREERYFSDSQSFSWSRKDFGDDIHYFLFYFKNTADYFKNPAE
ncbi:hypothetical protein JTB14_037049 [Gonioctena quinquepunctata]|nr:hypothetical protein JTB14_037049 [Gonioctena quinquepunctata]